MDPGPGERTRKYKWGTSDLLHIFVKWKKSEHVDTCLEMSQIISGHGCFGSYLARIGKRESSKCPYCGAEDTEKHTLLERDNRREGRAKVYRAYGPGNLILADILEGGSESEHKSTAFSDFARGVMRRKMADEKENK